MAGDNTTTPGGRPGVNGDPRQSSPDVVRARAYSGICSPRDRARKLFRPIHAAVAEYPDLAARLADRDALAPADPPKLRRVRIEMDRGAGWEIRQEGDVFTTADQLRDMLPAYAFQYPHRAFLDDVLVGEAQPPAKVLHRPAPDPDAPPPFSLLRLLHDHVVTRRQVDALEAGEHGAITLIASLADREAALLDLVLTERPRTMGDAAALAVATLVRCAMAEDMADVNHRAHRQIGDAVGNLMAFITAEAGVDAMALVNADFADTVRPFLMPLPGTSA